jgi:hypothetical protein
MEVRAQQGSLSNPSDDRGYSEGETESIAGSRLMFRSVISKGLVEPSQPVPVKTKDLV